MALSASTRVLFAIIAVVVVPAVLTLRTVEDPGTLRFDPPNPNPTPLGYTWSLLIYILPVAVLSTWFRRFGSEDYRRRAYRWTLFLLVPIGFGLDLALGMTLFQFPNEGANLNVFVPGFSFEHWGFRPELPVEEFVFYVTGFWAILLVYIWCDEDWLRLYNVGYDDDHQRPTRIVRLHGPSLLWGLLAIVVAVAYKWHGPHEVQSGFPLYFAFLIVASVVPSGLLFRAAQPYVNWRAFSLTFFWVLLTSLLWEASLASPYGWWRYDETWMVGIFIGAWRDLPLEAVILWLAVTFTTVILYEVIKVYFTMNRPLRPALLGDGPLRAVLRELGRDLWPARRPDRRPSS